MRWPFRYTGSLLEAAITAADRAAADPGRHHPLIPGERAFLAASSLARRRARRLRGLLAALTALTVALTATTIVALAQLGTADAERDQAIGNQLVSEAELLAASDPSLAAQLLLIAHRQDPRSRDLAWRLIGT